ncbi:MAG TPA: CheR family methyltransferase [Gemmatimonadaceae bacterium]|nr:CheR family methyltransferase [Gemmatimonadaceae bacterium]
MTTPESLEFDSLLDYLKSTRSFDFTAYKKPTLMRRIRRRMSVVGLETFGDYRLYLENQPEEFAQLFNTVLINVTTFFRDTSPWEFLRDVALPRLLEQKGRFDPIRVWSAGCATGEEAFTLAMILVNLLGLEAFRNRVKIYATDIDEDALVLARMATFTERDVDQIPAETLDQYFERLNGKFVFKKELRRNIIFGRHNLLKDAPISRVDILVCRNTLMYFNAPAQARILARLHFALNEGGYLLLGRAETLLAHSATFKPVDLKLRVFSKIGSQRAVPPLFLTDIERNDSGPASVVHDDIRDAAFNGTGLAQLVIDRAGELVLANDSAKTMFGITQRDISRPFHELEVSYRPLELRSLIEKAYAERQTVRVGGIQLKQAGEDLWLNVQVVPLLRRSGDIGGVSIIFIDVTATQRLQYALEHAKVEIGTAYEQLQSTNEEMETTNEELQSTVEELETTNEELQATNEELETMNEELQSTNDELQAINDVARVSNAELDVANHFLESIFSGLGHRVIVLDRHLNVILWNRGADDLWGVRAEEATHRPISELDIGLPIDQLQSAINDILEGRERRIELTVKATNRRGKPVDCDVSLAPLVSRDGASIAGVILLTEARQFAKDGATSTLRRA